MPSGAKKRKAAKKKQEQEASSTQINLKSNNHESRSQDDDAVRIKKEHEVDTDERIEITDSSHDHDKSSGSGSSSSSNSSSSSSSSDDESREVKKKDDSVSQVISVPDQPIPVAGDAPFMGSSANVIIEDTGLIDSTAANDPNSEKMIEILSVGGTMVSNETSAQVSSGTDSDVKEASSSLLESNDVPQGSRESEVVISHEEEEAAPVRPTHGVAQRTSWLSCCGLFD